MRAVFAFPLQMGSIAVGVLEVYRSAPGDLTTVEYRDALLYSDAAMALLLEHVDDVPSNAEHNLFAGGFGTRWDIVHQATGVISVQLRSGLSEAFLRLRGHAFLTGRGLADVAEDVIEGRLRFDRRGLLDAVQVQHRDRAAGRLLVLAEARHDRHGLGEQLGPLGLVGDLAARALYVSVPTSTVSSGCARGCGTRPGASARRPRRRSRRCGRRRGSTPPGSVRSVPLLAPWWSSAPGRRPRSCRRPCRRWRGTPRSPAC